MIFQYLKKILSFGTAPAADEASGLSLVKETLQRRSIYQLKLPSGHSLTNRLNFRPIELQRQSLILETAYQPFRPADFEGQSSLSFTVFMLPEADKLPFVVTCQATLLETQSNTRLRIAIPDHVENMGLNKSGRMQLEPRHMPVITMWLLDKKCSNIRLLKMFNPLLLYTPKRNDADHCLVDVSHKGMCISLGQDTYKEQQTRLKAGQDVLLQLSFPGPDLPQKHEFLIIGSIRYLRPKRKTGRMEIGVQFFHEFRAVPKPAWRPCEDDGIDELEWLLQKYKQIYLAEIKTKLSALCDVHSLDALADPNGQSSKFLDQERLAAKNGLALGLVRDLLPSLGHIQLTLEYLKLKSKEAQADALLVQALQQCASIQTRMETLQEMSSPDSPPFVPLRLGEAIEDALAAYADLMRQNGITVESTIQGDLPDILGDVRQLRLVFKNLFQNAIEAMRPTGGCLRATAVLDMPGDSLVVSVEDMGCGIPSECRSQLFVPYHQAAGENGRGLGLGLALCQRIVTGHGGQIDYYSALGEGTTFTIRLPLAPSPLAGPTSEVPA
jgi:signal transduction histidine kinase